MMVDSDYWNSGEYKFFSSLSDNEKLLYIYELIIYDENVDDDADEYMDDDDWDDDFEDNINKNKLIINSLNSITLSGESMDTIEDIAALMMMNGMILFRCKDDTINKDGYVSLSYKIVGKANGISLN